MRATSPRSRCRRSARSDYPPADGGHLLGCRRQRGAMTLLNTQDGYGALTKLFHWLVVALFAFQFAAANIMLRIDAGGTVLGLTQDTYYNWHKSIGLVALVVAVLRLIAR